MKAIAIVIASQYGQTEKIASAFRTKIIASGVNAELFRPKENGNLPAIGLERFDAVILGAPVYVGKFSPSLVKWTDDHVEALNSKMTAFYSVSLNAADKRPEARTADRRLLGDFVKLTGLKPKFVASIAGMLHYTKYGFFKRWMMKRISAAAGGPTDISCDHEMTDWNQVSAFVDSILAGDSASPFAFEEPLKAPVLNPKVALR